MPKLTDSQMAARRQEIVDATSRYLLEYGHASTSIHKICKKIGISVGTVYVHFKDKEALFVAVLKQAHKAGIDAWQEMRTLPADVAEWFLNSMTKLQAQTAASQLGRANIELVLLTLENPELRSVFLQGVRNSRVAIAELLQRETHRGGRKEFDATVETIYCVMNATFWELQFGYTVDLKSRADSIRLAIDSLVRLPPGSGNTGLIATAGKQSRAPVGHQRKGSQKLNV